MESMPRGRVEHGVERSAERTRLRDRMVGGLRASDHGSRQRLAGWVHRRRDLGGLVFIDLRDRSGLVQVSFGPAWTEPASLALAHELGHEDVILVEGTVDSQRLTQANGAHGRVPFGIARDDFGCDRLGRRIRIKGTARQRLGGVECLWGTRG